MPELGYNKYAYTWMINEKMSVLRARLLNLADSITSDNEQRKAVKGLIKDFCKDAYYPMLREIEKYLIFFKIIEEDFGTSNAPSLDEIKTID